MADQFSLILTKSKMADWRHVVKWFTRNPLFQLNSEKKLILDQRSVVFGTEKFKMADGRHFVFLCKFW